MPTINRPQPIVLIKNFLQRQSKIWWLLVGGASVLIVISSILRILTPQSVQIVPPEFLLENADGSTTRFANIVYSGETPSFPAEVPLAQAEPLNLTEGLVLDQLIAGFQLVERPQAKSIWNGPEYSLVVNQAEKNYTLVINPDRMLLGEEKIDETKALAEASKFLASILPGVSFTPQRNKIIYLDNSIQNSLTTPANAKMLSIPFAPTIDGIPVFFENRSSFPFSISINSQYQVQKLVFQIMFVTFVPKEKISLISISQAVENINLSRASIISSDIVNGRMDTIISTANVRAGNLKSVTLEYRWDETTGIAYPFYRFTGIIDVDSGESLQAEIVTPAIQVPSAP